MAKGQRVPNSEGTQFKAGAQQVEIARKGAQASIEAKRRKKNRKEWAQIIGSLPARVASPTGEVEGGDLDGALVMSMYRAAIEDGNVKAAKLLLDLMGDLEQTITLKGVAPINAANGELAKQMQKVLENMGRQTGEED